MFSSDREYGKEQSMSTPKGMKCVPKTLDNGDKVLVYSDTDHIVLQLRHSVATEEDMLAPSFKVAVPLTAAEAIAVASELLNAALPQLANIQAAMQQAISNGVPHAQETEDKTALVE